MNNASLKISNALQVDTSTFGLLRSDYSSIQNIIINIIILPHMP